MDNSGFGSCASLKKDKARDPNGLINELFKAGVAGKDFKLSLLKFFNRMKEETLFLIL